MKEEVLAVVDELKRLRKQGVDRVYVSEEALAKLRSFAVKGAGPRTQPSRDEVIQSIPEEVRSARASDFDQIMQEASKPSGNPLAKSSQSGGGIPRPRMVRLPDGDKETRRKALREIVLKCPVCSSRVKPGKKVVFGVGSVEAEIFFCGEAPGAEEEVEGEPFVGPAGQLLTKMIQAMGLRREQVYIANIMNWRPEMPTGVGNRPPTVEEMEFCLPYLKAQLEIVRPKVIVALGATAVKGLLGAAAFRNLRDVRGVWQDFEGTPVMPTYHPSYLLRNNTNRDKRAAWEDWLKVMEKVGMAISERQRGFFL